MTLLNYSLENLGRTFNSQKVLLKTEMNHTEIDEKNWRDKKSD